MKFKLVLLIFFFNLFAVNHGSAFFFHNDRPDSMRIEHTPIDQSTQANNRAYLYDNFFSGPSGAYLSLPKKGFVFIDEIKINVPMNMLMQDSVYPDHSIDRMMMANLRAKKLFDEYTDLQKKARLVVLDNIAPGEKKDKTKNSVSMEEGSNIDEKNDAIQKIMSHGDLLGFNFKEIESDENLLPLKHLSSMNDELNTPTESLSDKVSIEKNENTGRPLSTGPPVLSKTKHQDLPWILTGLLASLNYIISHRLEIMLYMIFITMIVFLTALKIRK